MDIYLVVYWTESGDNGVRGYWEQSPSEEYLERYFRENFPDEFDGEFKYITWERYCLDLERDKV